MEEIEIVHFRDEHAAAVKEMVLTVHTEFGFSYDTRLDYDLDEIQQEYFLEGGGFWVALHNRNVIGCIAIRKTKDDKVAEIKRMYLYPEYRGKGLGQRLLDLAILDAKTKGYKKVILDTTVKQKSAIKLYEKNSFSLIERVGSDLYYCINLD